MSKNIISHPFLGNDLVVNEDSCNLSCQYCLTGQSTLKETHKLQLIFHPPKRDSCKPGTPLRDRLDRIDQRVLDAYKCLLLKVTGGEIFLIDGMMDYLASIHSRYEIIIIQTNGVLIRPEDLDLFMAWGNVVLQISLDSHLYEGNSYRARDPRQHDQIIKRLTPVFSSKLPVEVYGVLNDRSVNDLGPFADWLQTVGHNLMLFPFPVRGPSSSDFQVKSHQISLIEDFVGQYERYQSILPARPYFDRLLRFFKEGGRSFRCHLPRLVVSTFSDGVLNACPNIWFSKLGNVLDDDREEINAVRAESGLIKALLAPRPRVQACKGCFTPWDLLSMYFDDELSIDELCASPAYANVRIRDFLEMAKAEYVASCCSG